MFKLFTFFTFMAYSISIYAGSEKYATVDMIKGQATVLIANHKEAINIEKGMKIPADSSIVTKEKSFIRLFLSDGSVINVSENSKVYIDAFQHKQEQPSVITMFKGKMRATVIKNNTDRVKMIIKTRQASMGVRGTDFLIAYDSSKDAVSLVTFEGKVAFVKKEDVKKETIEDLKQTLQETDNLIKEGEFSGVNTEKSTNKVQISKTQMEILKESFEEDKSKTPKKIQLDEKEVIVDLKTGQAVKGYTGFIDMATGEYTPIEGIELTNKGFVPKNKENSNVLKTALKFNNELSGKKFWSNRFTLFNEIYSQRNDFNTSIGSTSVKDDSILKFGIKYERSDLVKTYYVRASYFNMKPESLGASGNLKGSVDKSMNLKSIKIGYDYRINEYINLFSEVGVNDTLFMINNNITKDSYESASLGAKIKFLSKESLYPYLRLGYEYRTISYDNNSFELGLGGTKEFTDFGLFSDIWVNKSKTEQKGGLLLGVFVDF